MLKVICVLILLFVVPWSTWAAELQNPTRTPPKLVVVIVIDQFRYVCLTRFRDEYGRVPTEMLEAAAKVSVPASAPIPAKKRT